jgi:hypothetical protein
MAISLDHQALKADLEGSARALGVRLSRDDKGTTQTKSAKRERVFEAKLPRQSGVEARLVHEGVMERVKKLFTREVEVGASLFDEHVFVVTSTPEAAKILLGRPRVQTALMLLVTPTRYVEILGDVVRVVDENYHASERDLTAELLAVAAYAVV